MKDEEDPDGFVPNMKGAKMDKHKVKASLLGDFANALLKVAEVSQYGVEKYSRKGWLHVANGVERYTDSLYRHLLGESQETHDKESKLMHSAHVAWNALAKLELELLKLEKIERNSHGESVEEHKPPTSRYEPKPVATSSPNRAETWTCHYCQATLALGAKHTATECDDRISWKARS